MNVTTHFKKQIKYFDKEFSSMQQYELSEWQKSYIDKIKQYVLDKDFKKKTLLDIGTGSGYIAVEIARLGMHVIACDLSPQAIENLQKYKKKLKLKNLDLIICNAEKIPLRNGSVDYIVCNALLEHIPHEKKTIAEWKRLLNKKGKLFITVPLSLTYVWPFLWPINMVHDKNLGHLRRYDYGSLKNKFNLPIEKVFYTGHLVKVVGVIFSMILRTKKMDNWLERADRLTENFEYGANNISILFKNK